jgi:hypothetical protein
MKFPKLLPIVMLSTAGILSAQHTDLSKQPGAVFNGDRPQSSKPSKLRTIEGTVKDPSENPVSGAVVQLKDLRTSKVVDFLTKDDGKFAFHDLRLDVNYELAAKHGDLAAPIKKVTTFDTRNNVILTLKLEPVAKAQ